MNELVYPEEREMRKIKKKIQKGDFLDIIEAIEKYLEKGDPSEPFGTRIKNLQNQYRFPQYRLKCGDFRVMYNVEPRLLHDDIVYIIDIIPKKEWDMWLRTYGVKK